MLWFLLAWSILVFLVSGRRIKLRDSSLHCEVGIFQCACGSGLDSGPSAAAYGDDDNDKPPKKSFGLIWLVDLALWYYTPYPRRYWVGQRLRLVPVLQIPL